MAKNVVELNARNFDQLTSKGNWAIDFWAEWCSPCKIMSPEFDKASEEMESKVKFGNVNIDNEYDIAQRFEVMSIPSMIILKDGKEVDRTIGAIGKKEIIETITKAIKASV